MSIDPLKLFIVEYSVSQDSTHVRSLRAVLENNRLNLSRGLPTDYVPIGLVNSREEADSFVVRFHQTLAKDFQLELKSRNWYRVAEIVEELLGKVPPS